jgi:hypothetical protein
MFVGSGGRESAKIYCVACKLHGIYGVACECLQGVCVLLECALIEFASSGVKNRLPDSNLHNNPIRENQFREQANAVRLKNIAADKLEILT